MIECFSVFLASVKTVKGAQTCGGIISLWSPTGDARRLQDILARRNGQASFAIQMRRGDHPSQQSFAPCAQLSSAFSLRVKWWHFSCYHNSSFNYWLASAEPSHKRARKLYCLTLHQLLAHQGVLRHNMVVLTSQSAFNQATLSVFSYLRAQLQQFSRFLSVWYDAVRCWLCWYWIFVTPQSLCWFLLICCLFFFSCFPFILALMVVMMMTR